MTELCDEMSISDHEGSFDIKEGVKNSKRSLSVHKMLRHKQWRIPSPLNAGAP